MHMLHLQHKSDNSRKRARMVGKPAADRSGMHTYSCTYRRVSWDHPGPRFDLCRHSGEGALLPGKLRNICGREKSRWDQLLPLLAGGGWEGVPFERILNWTPRFSKQSTSMCFSCVPVFAE
jgi:hypothetical protein